MDFTCDVLIIGTGIAGLSAAAGLAERGLRVTIVTREKDPSQTNTALAQGGIIYARGSEDYLVEDIMRASSRTSCCLSFSISSAVISSVANKDSRRSGRTFFLLQNPLHFVNSLPVRFRP